MAIAFQTGAEPIPGYTLLDRLGSGGFGEVWRCEAPGGIFKAIKVIHGDLRYKDNDAYRFAEQELKALKRVKQVRHPYLLALDRYDIVDGRLCITMELADCNLWDRFRECRQRGLVGIPRDELIQYMTESAEVLDLMNDKHQLQHLDIKPQNLFLLYNHVKVADFGQVKDLELHVAQVTGGITPVYAAPETFDGLVSRFCDQYSLACVYQELLTGVRPFDGASMTQLMMQHLQHEPNLQPSPSIDRAALLRALSKKPEDRFDSVGDFVKAIRDGASVSSVISSVPRAIPQPGFSGADESGKLLAELPDLSVQPPGTTGYADPGDYHPYAIPPSDSATEGAFPGDTPWSFDRPGDSVPVLERDPIVEVIGDGFLRPSLIIGLGYAGFRTVQRFRKLIEDRYATCDRVPMIRTLAIDTDADGLATANQTTDRDLSRVPDEAIVPIPLNRSAYYLRPRNNGRALVEGGWIDLSLVHRLPRVPETGGVRCLGRLAYCDHYRTVMARIEAELEIATSSEARERTQETMRQESRTNVPIVYVVAGLGGGSGSGFLFDVAYSVRARLRRLGYSRVEIVGLLLVPPVDGRASPKAKANTFAALTELHHYGQPDTTFAAAYDDPAGAIRDRSAPFERTMILEGFDHTGDTSTPSANQTQFPIRRTGESTGALKSGTVKANHAMLRDGFDPTERAAQFLRHDALGPLGLSIEAARYAAIASEPGTFATFGSRLISWPRAAIVERAARVIAPVLLGHWVEPDAEQLGSVVPRWTQEQWLRYGLEREQLLAALEASASAVLGEPIDRAIARTIEPILPKGWLGRLPDPAQASAVLGRLTATFGPPRAIEQLTPLQEAVVETSRKAYVAASSDLMAMIPALLDTAQFRLAGTEEVVRQFLIALERNRAGVADDVAANELAAGAAFDRLTNFAFGSRAAKKPAPAEFAELLQQYPACWSKAILGKQLVRFYAKLHDQLLNRLNELAECRQRLLERHAELIRLADVPCTASTEAELMPAGCSSLEEAAQRYLKVLNDDDLHVLEAKFQDRLAKEIGGVFESCVNSAEGSAVLIRILTDVTRRYLDDRLGEVDFYGMLKQKYGGTAAVGQALVRAFDEAEPKLGGRGPWQKNELVAFLAPGGPSGLPIAQQAAAFLPGEAGLAEVLDEIAIYRTYPNVPLSVLDQLGPAWATAYKAAPEAMQATAHSRTDITRWVQVD